MRDSTKIDSTNSSRRSCIGNYRARGSRAIYQIFPEPFRKLRRIQSTPIKSTNRNQRGSKSSAPFTKSRCLVILQNRGRRHGSFVSPRPPGRRNLSGPLQARGSCLFRGVDQLLVSTIGDLAGDPRQDYKESILSLFAPSVELARLCLE